jgi:outer membrane autotransporter protein
MRTIMPQPSMHARHRTSGRAARWLAIAVGFLALACADLAGAQQYPPGSINMIYVSGDNQTAQIGSPVPNPLTVQLAFGGGFEVAPPPVKLAWSIVSGDATFAESSATTYTQTVPVDFDQQTAMVVPPPPSSVHVVFGSTPGTVRVNAYCAACSQSGGTYLANFTLTSTPAALAIVSGAGQTGAPGSIGDAPLVVQVGNPGIPDQTVNWRVVSGQATLSATTTTTDSSGKTSITFTFGSTPGTVVIQASTPNGAVTFQETAFAPQATTLSGNNQTGIAGSTLQPFVLQIGGSGTGSSIKGLGDGAGTNSATQGLGGVVVNWTVLQGGGKLAAPTTITDPSGRTSNTLTLGPQAGVNVVQASVPGAGSITFTATAIASVPSSSVFTIVSGDNQALVPGQPSQPLVVRLATSQGQPISGATIAWSVSGSSGKLDNPTTPTDANGQAQNRLTVILPASYTVTAQVNDASGVPPLTFHFSNAVANLPSLTPAQISVAHAIDRACPALATSSTPLTAPQQDLLARCSEIVVGAGSHPEQIPEALNQMLNNKAQPQSSLATSVQLSQLGNLNTRLAELRQGASGLSLGGLTLVNDGRSLPLAALSDLFKRYLAEPAANDEAGKDFARWGFFATGMIDRGGASADGVRPGFDFHNASLTAGVDYRFSDAFVAGLALGYNQSRSDLDLGAGKIDVDGYSLNGYFTWYRNNDFYVEGSLVADWLNYDLRRHIVYGIASLSGGETDVDQTAKASPNGHQYSLALSLGKDFSRGAWSFSPYLRGVYTHLSLDGFSETMSDPNAPGAGLGTRVEARAFNSALGVLGGRVSRAISFDWGVLVPNAVVEWNHEFRNDPQTVVTRFLADPTQTPIVLTDRAPDANYFNLGIGLNAVLPQGRSGYFYYEHVAGLSGAHENRFSLGIRIEF